MTIQGRKRVMNKKIKLIILLNITVAVLAAISFQKKFKEKGSTFDLVLTNQIRSFDPAVIFNDDSLIFIGQALETLYQYHYLKRPYELQNLIAESKPEILNNGTLYRIKIKKGIFYHNSQKIFPEGRDVQANDFVWAMKRIAFKPIKSTGTWLFQNKVKGFNEFSTKAGNSQEKFYSLPLKGIRAIDKYTLEIELTRPESNFPYYLAMPFMTPQPIELIKHVQNDLKNTLIGTGPYEYHGKANNKYIFKRFKKFHYEAYPSSGDRYANTENLLLASKKVLPFIDNLTVEFIKDEDLLWEEFLKGNFDLVGVSDKHLAEVLDNNSELSKKFRKEGIEVKHFSRQSTRWLGFNMSDPVLGKNLDLRKAISHAVDYDKYLKDVGNNTNLKANSIYNPTVKGYRPEHRLGNDFNLVKAKSYLKKAGYKPGELTLIYSTRGKRTIHYNESKFIKEQLALIGINLEIEFLEFDEFLSRGRRGKLQFWTDSWIYDYPDAENIVQLLFSGNHPGMNKSGVKNKKLDKLYMELSETNNEKRRVEILHSIESIVQAELPWIMLMYESSYILKRKNIKNFRKSFFIRNFIKYLEVDN